MFTKKVFTKRWRAAAGIAVAGAILLFGGAARAGMCGWCFNSATVGDGIVFDELNVHGIGRPGGPRILNRGAVTMADGAPAKLRVRRHFLSAVGIKNKKTYSGDELVGMTFSLGMEDGRTYKVRLSAVKGCLHKRNGNPCGSERDQNKCTPLRFWASPHEEVPQYDFDVQKTSKRTKPLTAAAAAALAKMPSTRRPVVKDGKLVRQDYKNEPYQLETDDRDIEPDFKEHLCRGEFTEKDVLWDAVKNSAIAFEGDHYDPATKKVTKTNPAAGWFNLACYGAAVSKMHLLRHTEAGGITFDGTDRTTSLRERTAMLKAITADYCGSGTAWTGDGTPLLWTDANGWFPDPKLDLTALVADGMIESVWGPQGALCLNEPRRLTKFPGRVYPDSACSAPAVTRKEIEDACKAAGRKFGSAPPGVGGPGTTPDIPRCDAAWMTYWPTALKSAGRVHVLSANVKDAPRNYCDVP